MTRHKEALENLTRLEQQFKADHHPSDTVVVSKKLLRSVIRRAKAVETYGKVYDIYYIDKVEERIGG